MFCCFSSRNNLEDVEKVALKDVEKADAKKFEVHVDVDGNVGKVVEVYDGDTFTMVFYSRGELCHAKVRMNGIDTPEIKGETDQEKAKAIVARDALRKLLLGKVIAVSNLGIEKWGRILADVHVQGVHVNDYMLKEGHAVPYGGKHGLTKTHVW